MKEKLLTKNKSQRMLTGVMVALFFVLSVCTIFTGKYVPTEKGLHSGNLNVHRSRMMERDISILRQTRTGKTGVHLYFLHLISG